MAVNILTDNNQVAQSSIAASDYNEQAALQQHVEQECVIIARTLESSIEYEREFVRGGAVVYYLYSSKPFIVHVKHANPIHQPAYAPQQARAGLTGYYADVVLWDGEHVTVQEVA